MRPKETQGRPKEVPDRPQTLPNGAQDLPEVNFFSIFFQLQIGIDFSSIFSGFFINFYHLETLKIVFPCRRELIF